MNEDQKVDIDQSLDRPFLFARKIALPQCFGVALQELVPGIGVIVWQRSPSSIARTQRRNVE